MLSPYDVPQGMVFGEPVAVGGPVDTPSTEQLAALHARYVAALTELFERKAEFGYADRSPEVVSALKNGVVRFYPPRDISLVRLGSFLSGALRTAHT